MFGGYIHTYKFSEGVEDGVVLDLVYEARDIDQRIGSVEKIDAWFEAKTRGLNDWQKEALKRQWGTLQSVLSSRSPYEADMRHLIDTYIEAAEPRKISPFDGLGLMELIVKTGIADAINRQLGGLKGNKDAIAETIENNVRSKIVRGQLNDPAFFAKMSALLDGIIAERKAKAIEYEEYLKRISDLVKRVDAGKADDTPVQLDTPGKQALYNNLPDPPRPAPMDNMGDGVTEFRVEGDPKLALALRIDAAIRRSRPDGWRGVQTRELVIKRALFEILQDAAEVECLAYVLVHELTHFLEPTHNERFVALMDRFLPRWRFVRQTLNQLPVRHEEWDD